MREQPSNKRNMARAQHMIMMELMRGAKMNAADAEMLALKITMRLSVEHMDMFSEHPIDERRRMMVRYG